MKKDKLYIILCLILATILSGCIEEYQAEIPTTDSDILVVNGTIRSSEQNTFILSLTQAINSDPMLKFAEHAIVSVRGTDGSEYEVDGFYGVYSCWIGELNPDVEYYLHIEYDGDVYESEPQKPLRTEKIADVSVVQNTPESNIDILVTPDAPFNPDKTNYYSWECDETWEVHSEYRTTIYYDIDLKKAVYNDKQFPWRGWKDATKSFMVGASNNYEGQHIQRLKIYDIDRSDERVYYKYSGLVHQRAISKAEYEYELACKQASSEMGGLFTPQPSSLPTNIRCLTSSRHVIGFVGCAMNTSAFRFFLNADDYSIEYPPYEDTRLWVENPSDMNCIRLLEKGMFLCAWIDERLAGKDLQTAWAFQEQLDVRYKGAYTDEPSFWSFTEDDDNLQSSDIK
ncbi:DUF4249 domain-containing protein [Prevotella sp. P6B1]|uniref:DUF4249 domain-containing protein n=1 Tax=Prevotella sp. P6B1 TaxID=1410613 RepID=UPI00051C0C0F|nr:DUF4249 domain-containing protein [Prevotella sp. P6B1]